ncbi:MAG TPA: A24 family peptidase [Isosphaeraceae bacterium]|jgi:prepilin peptidase CpaA|nr:A24 family peptidase [Isosphaeraceae bacterium]
MTQLPQVAVWFVTAMLVEAAVIDGLKLKVPNWLTFNFAIGGVAFAAYTGGATGVMWALVGAAVGLAVLLPLYAIGGMGAGDVKLMAGVGAWMGPAITLGAFVATGIVGGLMALVMIARSGAIYRHLAMFQTIGQEIITVRDPVKLAESAAKRKPTMMLLPYGIPIAIGSIAYFAWLGILI